MEPRRDTNEPYKRSTSKDKFDWSTFDLDRFFRDTEKAGEIIRKRDISEDGD